MESRKFSRRSFIKSGLALGGAAAVGPWVRTDALAAKPDHKLVFGHTFGKATEDVMITGLNVWKERAEALAEGSLELDIHEAGSLGGQTVLPQKVLTGAIQGCQLSTQNFTPYSDVYNLLDFPYMFPSNEKFEQVLASDAFQSSAFMSQPASKGFRIVPGMWANAGFRVLGISKKADRIVKSPEDLKDIKIRVTGSKVEQQVFRLTPASPVSIAWGETYQALQQGAADALNVGLGPLTATKIYETLGSATLSEINFNCHLTALSGRWFDSLPGRVQDAVLQGAAESFAYQREGQAKANQEMIDMWKAAGIEVTVLTPEEKKVWNETLGHTLPVWDSFKQDYGADLYADLVNMAA